VSLKHQEPVRVVVITEKRLLAGMVRLTLSHGVYETRDALTIGGAQELIGDWHPHLIVADIDGADDQILRRIRQAHLSDTTRTPILAVTRKSDLKTKLAAFDQGAEDVMTIPLSPEELLARILVITRRTIGQNPPLKPVLKLGELEMDILNRQVRVGSSELHLTGLEQSLLYLLASNAGQVVTRDDILDHLWGVDYMPESNVVDRHVRTLRVKLQNGSQKPRFIATVPGRGYRFVPELSEPQSAS
jgi:DNA-binding response OmpR family regulator